MIDKKGFIIHVLPNDYNENEFLNDGINDPPEAYILCKKYFKNDKGISIEQFLNKYSFYNHNINLDGTKINFLFEEIMNLIY